MKIMTKKDFEELNDHLIWIEGQFRVTIDTMEEYIEFHCKDENLKKMFENLIKWSRRGDGPERLFYIRQELRDRGIHNKGLRY